MDTGPKAGGVSPNTNNGVAGAVAVAAATLLAPNAGTDDGAQNNDAAGAGMAAAALLAPPNEKAPAPVAPTDAGM